MAVAEKIYYTNDSSDFSEVRRIKGKIGKRDKNDTPSDCISLREEKEDDKGKKQIKWFTIRPLDTYKFLAKKYWMFSIFYCILVILFLFYSPLYAIPFVLLMEGAIYFFKPYETIGRAKTTDLFVKASVILLFLISAYFLFGKGLGNIANSMTITKITLFMTIILYSRTAVQKLIKKYKKIYKLVKYESEDGKEEYNEEYEGYNYYLWEKQI